jgi:hypothetical protein
LRTKVEDRSVIPLIIDIVDPHPALKRQYQKRKTTYNKYDYGICDMKWSASTRTLIKSKPIKKSKHREIEDISTCLLME